MDDEDTPFADPPRPQRARQQPTEAERVAAIEAQPMIAPVGRVERYVDSTGTLRERVIRLSQIPFLEEGWRKWSEASPAERAAAVAEVAEVAAQIASLPKR